MGNEIFILASVDSAVYASLGAPLFTYGGKRGIEKVKEKIFMTLAAKPKRGRPAKRRPGESSATCCCCNLICTEAKENDRFYLLL